MKLQWTHQFAKDYRSLPRKIQKQADRKLGLLLENVLHPSLRVKKIKGSREEIYEASVTVNYRVLFQKEADVYILRRIGAHDILGRVRG